MSSIQIVERQRFEKLLEMSSGYVLNFTDATFSDFIAENTGKDIHSNQYSTEGTSKAKKLRCFLKIEPDYLVGKLLLALIDYHASLDSNYSLEVIALSNQCRDIANRLLTGGPRLDSLKERATILNANHLAEQIRRMESSVETDPSLAIGTAKEMIETCCKMILSEHGKTIGGTSDIPTLTKETCKVLKLVPEEISDSARGSDVIKRLLSNLGTIGNGLAELRGLYGTGHGKHGNASSLTPRHAKLAVGAAATLITFLFETHKEMETSEVKATLSD